MLNEEGCWIQVQQGVVTVIKGDRIILKGEKCEGLYKLKEENSILGRVSGISLEGILSRGGVSRKTAMGHELGQSIMGRRNGAFEQHPKWPKP